MQKSHVTSVAEQDKFVSFSPGTIKRHLHKKMFEYLERMMNSHVARLGMP